MRCSLVLNKRIILNRFLYVKAHANLLFVCKLTAKSYINKM